jgi:hypothetical protein
MSESEFLEAAWQSCLKRVAAMIGDYSASWTPTGPSKAAADAIRNRVKAMPMPARITE